MQPGLAARLCFQSPGHPEGPQGSPGLGSPVGTELPARGAGGAWPVGGSPVPCGHSQAGHEAVVVTAGPLRTGAAGSLAGSHCSEHLLCAGEGAPELLSQRWAGAVRHPDPLGPVSPGSTALVLSHWPGFGTRLSYTQE